MRSWPPTAPRRVARWAGVHSGGRSSGWPRMNDRGVELAAAYAEAVDVKDKIKVSREIRPQEMATTRLLSKVSTAVPAPESFGSIKARNAVNKRVHPDACGSRRRRRCRLPAGAGLLAQAAPRRLRSTVPARCAAVRRSGLRGAEGRGRGALRGDARGATRRRRRDRGAGLECPGPQHQGGAGLAEGF